MVSNEIILLRVICNVFLSFLVLFFSENFLLGVFTGFALTVLTAVQVTIVDRRKARMCALENGYASLEEAEEHYRFEHLAASGMSVAASAMLANQYSNGDETDLNDFSSIDAMQSTDHEIMTDPFFTTDFSGHSDMTGMNSFTSDSCSMDSGLSSSSINSCGSCFNTDM